MDRRFQLTWPQGELPLTRCQVMGILNVTPDSFSDGGEHLPLAYAVKRAWQVVEEGADILDVGGESTRPGSEAVDESVERSRLWPLLRELNTNNYPIPISLDSSKPRLIRDAGNSGYVQIINDVCGLRDPKMRAVVIETGLPVIIMHMFGQPRSMQNDYHYDDVVEDLISFFGKRLEVLGREENVILDPGIGFGKSVEHNLTLLRRLSEFKRLGFPLMIGASRKSFIGKVLDLEVEERLEGSLAAAAVAVSQGASIVRVHDVRASVRVIRLVESVGGSLGSRPEPSQIVQQTV